MNVNLTSEWSELYSFDRFKAPGTCDLAKYVRQAHVDAHNAADCVQEQHDYDGSRLVKTLDEEGSAAATEVSDERFP
jgi:hypothetical protein